MSLLDIMLKGIGYPGTVDGVFPCHSLGIRRASFRAPWAPSRSTAPRAARPPFRRRRGPTGPSLAAPPAASVDGPESRRLVAWLEDTKIRNMKKEERAGLRDVASGGWEAALRSYLEGLECPFEYTPETRAQVLEWLLSYATMLEYQDSRDAITRARAAAAAPREAVLEDSGLPEVAQGVERVARSLGITSSGTVDQINSIRNLIAAKK